MTQFRPCIDLHQGQVKQIVGGSLTEQGATTNFISDKSPEYYARLYQQQQLKGGHVIALGAGNEAAAKSALAAYPAGLQFGGGIHLDNAKNYLDAGASHVIVTSYLFEQKQFSFEKLEALKKVVGKDKLVLDLSCRRVEQNWFIATDRWQTITQTSINAETLKQLAQHCSEFLIHAADVEGLQAGIDEELVALLGQHAEIPMTYAGGAKSLDDLDKVDALSNGTVDLTIGSALDIFGGKGVTLQACIEWNQANVAE